MYESIVFPAVATDAVQFERFKVSVDPTFACIVVQHTNGHDIFRYNEESGGFFFVCTSIYESAAIPEFPDMSEIADALRRLMPWLAEEVAAVKSVWVEFFDGTRQLPMLTKHEKQVLKEFKMRLVAGVIEAEPQL